MSDVPKRVKKDSLTAFRQPEEEKERWQREADAREATISDLIRHAVNDFLARNPLPKKKSPKRRS